MEDIFFIIVFNNLIFLIIILIIIDIMEYIISILNEKKNYSVQNLIFWSIS